MFSFLFFFKHFVLGLLSQRVAALWCFPRFDVAVNEVDAIVQKELGKKASCFPGV